ncbi:hypothetical protein NLJ89_g3251 [Agrocybe chaxingu]|uniref:Uncharacterized protein n=1 Tax=Agrocybe chaxingu TaxID=84603 RepID=A0A9W8K585_9AGAR|nr:hypothetical protein NLJ89_g3251 [Agrocybe chaxingu]
MFVITEDLKAARLPILSGTRSRGIITLDASTDEDGWLGWDSEENERLGFAFKGFLGGDVKEMPQSSYPGLYHDSPIRTRNRLAQINSFANANAKEDKGRKYYSVDITTRAGGTLVHVAILSVVEGDEEVEEMPEVFRQLSGEIAEAYKGLQGITPTNIEVFRTSVESAYWDHPEGLLFILDTFSSCNFAAITWLKSGPAEDIYWTNPHVQSFIAMLSNIQVLEADIETVDAMTTACNSSPELQDRVPFPILAKLQLRHYMGRKEGTAIEEVSKQFSELRRMGYPVTIIGPEDRESADDKDVETLYKKCTLTGMRCETITAVKMELGCLRARHSCNREQRH